MKIFVRFFGVLLLILTFIVTLLVIFDYSYVLRGIEVVYLKGHSTAYIDDFTEFENRAIPAGEEAHAWPYHSDFNKVEPTSILKETNKDLQTIAFLIIKNDSIWYENYRDGYNANSKSNSFSMAKSITSALLGKAIKDGYIKSIDQPVTDFYPEYKDQFGEKLSVGDLASMASGLNWDEDYYNPFSQTARVYFDDNIREVVLDLELIDTPGTSFKYLSGNTILLGMVIEKATGKNLSAYLSESFWKPLGMEQDALWQLDSKESGMEKAYCCIASNAKDFARFGKLYKDKGNWKETQVLDTAFIERSVSPRFEESPEYGYGWWLANYNNKEIFYMRGVLGQYVIVIPEDDVIIVRLGHKLIKRKEGEDHAPDFYIYIEEALKMLNNDPKT
jgi:CubicO group peptidase (beta-lactamase class C family)